MPYDPQRSHRRPQLADDDPAPVDALLDAVDDAAEAADTDELAVVETVVDTVVVTETVDATTGEVVDVDVVETEVVDLAVVDAAAVVDAIADAALVTDEIEVASARRTPRVAVLVAGLVVALLLLVWVRRRR